MLKKELKSMIELYGKKKTQEKLLKKIKTLSSKIAKAPTIYHAIDIEHELMDTQAMLKWLKTDVPL